MDDFKKSQSSLRQSIRNPSGRVVIAFSIGVIAVLLTVFFLTEFDDIKENLESAPKLVVVTAGPPPHRWTGEIALDFFREYAIARPAPGDRVLSAGVETCWDFATSESSGPLVPFHMASNVNSLVAPLASIPPLWGLAAGDSSWRFWENTLSVVGPC
ncbi:MAG: hypothetical protein IIB28_04170 [Chloroflexi bacterium]|nr:hypothetical protein [Chloroflexota bacterium]